MNLWRRFQQLANPPTLITVGTCVSADFGYCTIEFPGGSSQRVQGAGTVGTHYYIREGRLDGEAPALSVITIEI